VRWVATECSWNDGSEIQYYIVILDWLQGSSGELERVPELRVRGPLTKSFFAPMSLPVCQSLLSGSAITIKYHLFSEVV